MYTQFRAKESAGPLDSDTMLCLQYLFTNPFWRTQMFLADVKSDIGEWALRNFGDNNGLEHVGPLLGIGEELTELDEANLYSDVLDAVGDVLIFLGDFCSRLKVDIHRNPVQGELPDFNIVRNYHGKLMRLCLKNNQGIRGYDDEGRFLIEVEEGVRRFYEAFISYCTYTGIDAGEALEIAWGKVRRRDWVQNRQDALVNAS